jgi:predicted nucleic acid-binding Zn ribbon protein
VRSVRDRLDEIWDSPKKLKRAFTFIWVVAYLMLILGFILIVWIFLYQIF